MILSKFGMKPLQAALSKSDLRQHLGFFQRSQRCSCGCRRNTFQRACSPAQYDFRSHEACYHKAHVAARTSS